MAADAPESPPSLPRRLGRLISRDIRYSALGDFEEIYADMVRRRGPRAARLWLWKEILRSSPSFLADSLYWSLAMFRHYLVTALRNLKRQKLYSFINILGLSIGIAVSLLVALYVLDETSYDRYHENAGRIFRLAFTEDRSYKTVRFPLSSGGLAPALVEEVPEVQDAVRFRRIFDNLVRLRDRQLFDTRMFYADPSVFSVFSFHLVKGDPGTALADPKTAVITVDMAKKLFPDEDPMGQVLTLEDDLEFEITGVAENVPENSHFGFDLLASAATLDRLDEEWRASSCYTYLLIRDGFSPGHLETKIAECFSRHKSPNDQRVFFLQPLTKIHLHSHLEREIEPNGDAAHVSILSVVALFILLIACVNFMNLSTARSAGRAKEVGVRKISGAHRRALIRQFLGESVILTFVACLLGILLLRLSLPAFAHLAAKPLSFAPLTEGAVLVSFIILITGVGLLAGIYPALFLSRYEPAKVLKGFWKSGGRAPSFRNILVIIQFSLSILMIIGTFLVRDQLDFILNRNLGFDKENVVVCQADNPGVQANYRVFKNELLKNPGVVSVTAATSLPGLAVNPGQFRAEGEPDFQMMGHLVADEDFLKTMGIGIAEGRSFSWESPSDIRGSIVLNEEAAKRFGWTSAAGKTVEIPGEGKKTVIGVMRNFHHLSKRQRIDAIVLQMLPGHAEYLVQFIAVKVRPERIRETITDLRKKWSDVSGGRPPDYAFLDEDYDALYKKEERLEKVFASFTALAVFVACLGLFGLASFTAERRRKEIGIRKTLGATIPGLLVLLSKEYAIWMITANIVAWPVAYVAASLWLRSFAYRTGISPETFIMAGGIAALAAFLTIGAQTLKASLANPVESLRYE
jgi:putative ABC transport system permease protein